MPAPSQNDIPIAAQVEQDKEATQTENVPIVPSNASAERDLGHCCNRCPSVAVVPVKVSLTLVLNICNIILSPKASLKCLFQEESLFLLYVSSHPRYMTSLLS
jgi:hypothetical protein